jgi:hypothetical protein
MTKRFILATFTALAALAAVSGLMNSRVGAAAFVNFTVFPTIPATGPSGMNPIGIDWHQPTNQLSVSVNYIGGAPHNLELVAANGQRT